MRALPAVESPLSVGVVEEAVGLYRTARRQGVTVRSSVDCLIAACALDPLMSKQDQPLPFTIRRQESMGLIFRE